MTPLSSAQTEAAMEGGRPAGGAERRLTPHRVEARQRLRCIAGHLRGVGGMVEVGTGWRETVTQIRAVRRALNDVVLILLAEHLATIVAGAQTDDAAIEMTLLETKSALLGGLVIDDAQGRSIDGHDREGGQGCLHV